MDKTSPPDSLAELIDLYAEIYRGKHAIRLNQRSLSLLKAMIDAPDETAAKSITELAEEHDVHNSSITRLAQRLGYKGFHELKRLFRDNLKKQQSYYTGQVEQLLRQDQTETQESSSIVDRVVQDECNNVLQMAEKVDIAKFQAIIDLIKKAEDVVILGLRGSYPVAYYLSFYLGMILDRVSLAGQSGHILGEDLSKLGSGSLLIAFGVTPYTRETIEACRLCADHGIELVAITDTISSPLAAETRNVLLTPIKGSYFFSPVAAMMVCVESILAELVIQLDDKALTRLNRAETFLGAMEVEL